MSKIKLIQEAQQSNDQIVDATTILTEIASNAHITFDMLVETVNDVLTNISTNIKNGRGLTSMGGNINNYAYFLAGLETIATRLSKPEFNVTPQGRANTIKKLAALSVRGGLISSNCQEIVDLGSRPELQPLVYKYEQLLKGMQTQPEALINAVGQLRISMDRLIVAQPAVNTAPALKTRPMIQKANKLAPSGPSQAGSMPAGGSGV